MAAPSAQRLANPFAGDVPTQVESRLQLEDVEFTAALAYNPRGTYLASGTTQGELVVWDLATLSPAMRVGGLHAGEVNSVAWVRKARGRLVCTASQDGWVKTFDLDARRVRDAIRFQDEVIGASTNPEDPRECLVCLAASTQSAQDGDDDAEEEDEEDEEDDDEEDDDDEDGDSSSSASSGNRGDDGSSDDDSSRHATKSKKKTRTAKSKKQTKKKKKPTKAANKKTASSVPWPSLHRFDAEDKHKPLVRYVIANLEKSAPRCFGVAASFSKHGKLVYVGGPASSIHVFATHSGETLRVVHPAHPRAGPGPRGWVLGLSTSRNGRLLISDAGGKFISVYDVASDLLASQHDALPQDASMESLQDALRWRVNKPVAFRKNVQNAVNPTKWCDIGCSGNAEFILGAPMMKDTHELLVWDVTGRLVHLGKDSQTGFGVVKRSLWHPWRPQIATVTGDGVICLWGNASIVEDKSWLAFAPGFVEIEENIVYESGGEDDNEDEVKMDVTTTTSHPSTTPTPAAPSDDANDLSYAVDVMKKEAFVEMFSDDEDSEEDEMAPPSRPRQVPRSVSRGIGFFIPAQSEVWVDVSSSSSKLPSSSSS